MNVKNACKKRQEERQGERRREGEVRRERRDQAEAEIEYVKKSSFQTGDSVCFCT